MNAVHADFWPFAAIVAEVLAVDLYWQIVLRTGLARYKLRGYQRKGVSYVLLDAR